MTSKELPADVSSPETAHQDFLRQGYVLLPDVLDGPLVSQLRVIIDKHAQSNKKGGGKKKSRHAVFRRVFEQHPEICLQVFKNETVLPLVKSLLGCCGSIRGKKDNSLEAHLIHNNAFRVDPGMRGQAPGWHTDDPPIFQTADGRPLPKSVTFAPLVLTCMYFLNDLTSPNDGGTRVIEGSHRFGCLCSDEAAAKHQPHLYAKCPAGSVLIISAHTWHRGAAVTSDSTAGPRYVFQATYGRRLVGHKHNTIMNYALPRKVESLLKTEEERKLMGFLQGGAYS